MTDVIISIADIMSSEIKSLEAIAQNSANVNTPGYKSQVAYMSNTNFADQVFGSATPELNTGIVRSSGALNITNGNLDLAIVGEGWFLVDHPQGRAVTRNGAFIIDQQNRLTTSDGYPVLADSGEILLEGQELALNGDEITDLVSGEKYNISIVSPRKGSEMHPLGNALYLTQGPQEKIDNASIALGALEQSNVNTADDMVRLMQTTRHVESLQRAITTYNDMLDIGINQIGK